jgi:hypothetical protein
MYFDFDRHLLLVLGHCHSLLQEHLVAEYGDTSTTIGIIKKVCSIKGKIKFQKIVPIDNSRDKDMRQIPWHALGKSCQLLYCLAMKFLGSFNCKNVIYKYKREKMQEKVM